jgi:3-keto-disaccharide hydrolase
VVLEMHGIRLGVAAWLLLASSNVVFAACQGSTILFEDRFDSLQPTWGTPSEWLKVENGKLVVAPEPAAYFWATNQASLYDDIDMCVAMTTVAGVEPDEVKAGLVFWYDNANNFYVLEFSPNGQASVWRRQRGEWLEQIQWKDIDGAHTGDNAVNELRVVTKGNQVTAYLNETEVGQFTGIAPNNGQQVGVFVASPESGTAQFAFDNLKVTRP